jgi:hypothetical protein
VELACDTLPHGDHEPLSEKDADLPEVHFGSDVVEARSAEDDELDVLLETLELRAQVKRLGVFYRKLVQPEGLPHLRALPVAARRDRAIRTHLDGIERPPRRGKSGPRAGGDPLGNAHSR